MAFVPIPNVALAELRYTIDNQFVENTLWFDSGAGLEAENLQVLAEGLATWYETNLIPLQVSALVLREIYVTAQDSAFGAAYTYTPIGANQGALNIEPEPNNVSMCVSFRTASRGRAYRGRNYVLGLGANQLTGNRVDQTVADNYVLAYQQLNPTLVADGFTHIVASRSVNGAPRVVGVASPVTAYLVVDNVVDSQRRRLPGRGR